MSEAIKVQVHERGDRRIDGILRLIAEAGRARPLFATLQTLVAEIAAITACDVVSVYLREDPEVLVMRANVGFPREAVGRVRLRVGQGITGFVAECLRPVSVAVAPRDEHFAYVPGLGEEHFPSFLAVPIFASGGVEGVLVLQRRSPDAFASAEVALATALATPFGYAIDRSRARLGRKPSARSARLSGRGLSPGHALGRVVFLPTFQGLPIGAKGDEGEAFEGLERTVKRVRRKLSLSKSDDAELASLLLLFRDDRLRRLARAECQRFGVVEGLRAVAATYASACYAEAEGASREWRIARVVELEDLCLLAAASASGSAPALKDKLLIVPDRLSTLVVLTAIARGAAGIVVSGEVDDSLAARVARAAGLPLIADVVGLYSWIREDDRALIDGTRGVVRINPRVSAAARAR